MAFRTNMTKMPQIPKHFLSKEEKQRVIDLLSEDLSKAKTEDQRTSAANRLAKAMETTVARKPKAVA